MRVVEIGTQRYTKVFAVDEPDNQSGGGACHEYGIKSVKELPEAPSFTFAHIHFQRGPIKECGVNGAHNEDLIAIVLDRLQHFQKGDFACRENALAITKLEEALHWLGHRTAARERRGVEGTNQK